MKFTSMQSALAVGALSAVAVPALADNASGGPSELVLYVVNTANNTAYSRGLQINMNTLAISGAFSASGYTSTFTGNISPGSTVEMGIVTAEAVANGYTTGYGSQNVLSINYTLPTILADANLTSFLSAPGGTFKWSIQSAGNGGGNGTGFSRRFITTSASSYDNGTNVTTGNLGMAGTDANAWSDIVSMVQADNALNPSTTNGDGTSITNSTYLSFLNGGQNASTWYSAATSVAGAINALVDLGSAANFYEVISCCGATQSAGSKNWVLTLNDVTMDASGNLNAVSLPPSHYVIPNIAGLGNGKCVVLNDGSLLNQTKTFCNNGSTAFNSLLNVGLSYNVTVTGQPDGQVCLVNNGSGVIGNADVNVLVTCSNITYTVSGTVTGLQQGKPLALLLNSGTPVTISSNGTFTFPTTIATGSSYAVAVGIQPSGQRCTVTNGTGTVSVANVNNISVDCVNDFTVSGLVSGLKGSRLVLNLNGTSYKIVSANGSFTFLTGLVSGSIYDVKVGIQPAQQFCYVSNGTGTISGASTSNISVDCTDNYAVGGTVTGLNPGSCIGLQLNGSANRQVCTNGSYSFASRLPSGVSYSVGVSSQPSQQVCYVNNRSGTMPNTDLTNVDVTCASTYTVGGTVTGLLPGQTVTLVNSASQAAVSFPAPAAAPAQFSGAGTVGYTFSLDDARTLTSLGLYNTDLNANTVVSIWNSSGGMVTSGLFDTNLSGLDLGDLNNSGFLWLKMPSISLQPGLYTIGAFSSADHFGVYGVTSTPLNGVHVVNSSLLSFATASDKPTVDFSGLYPNGFFGPNLRFSPNDDQITAGNGSFTFPTGLESGAQYSVVVSGQPDGVVCTVNNGSGTVATANVTNLAVNCQSRPAAPVATVSYNHNPNQVILNWSPVSGATYYTIGKDPNGSSSFSPICQANGPTATTCIDAFSKLTDFITATYKVTACNAAGCTDAAPIAAFTTQTIQYLKASNTNAYDNFGYSVALSTDGSTLAVGAFLESSSATGINGNQADNSDPYAGAVYVFVRSGSTWSQQAYIKASNTDGGDSFGYTVALSTDGSTLAVGANAESSSATGINGNQADNSASNAGAVYVYTRTGSAWSQQAYIKASNTDAGTAAGYHFGRSVALSADGSTLAVGANAESSSATGINGNQADNSDPYAGAVYVFTRSGSAWSQQAYLKASNTNANDNFGYSVALSTDGSMLAVGAKGESSSAIGINGNQADNSDPYAGAVYVFVRSGSTWSQQAYIKASNTDLADGFGNSIALSADGSTLAVGANTESSSATGINGNQSDNGAASAGAVYVFTRSGSTWSQQAYLKASNTNANDNFGYSVALSADGSTLAVGAHWEASAATGINGNQGDNSAYAAGAVYVFTRSGTTWSQQAYVKASNNNASDSFGISVALSADGSTLAVGARGEDSAATGINGNQSDNTATDSGAVYVYSGKENTQVTAIVNMDALVNATSDGTAATFPAGNSPVVVYLPAGTYDLVPIDQNAGGLFTSMILCTCSSARHWYYDLVTSEQYSPLRVGVVQNFYTLFDAFASAPTQRVTLAQAGWIKIFLVDFPISDNALGISLKIQPVTN